MKTENSREQEVGFEEAVFPILLEHTVDVDGIELSGRLAGHSYQSDIAPVLVCSWTLHQPVFLSPGNDASPSSVVVYLKRNKQDYLACVAFGVRVANGYPLLSRIVIERDLNDVLGIALDADHLGNVEAKGQYRMKTGLAAYSAHCVRVLCVEAACQ